MIRWTWSSFHDLSVQDLYAILRLRQEVFVLEQRCLYQDLDGRDQHALHLMGCDADGTLAAYLRLVEPGYRFAEPSIGRVVTRLASRATGLGKALMHEGLRMADATYPGLGNRIAAQEYLERFYTGFGYSRVGEPYDEDGILHIDMVRRPGGMPIR